MLWPGGLASACGWLDGQDGQLPVDHAMFSRPCAQRLDDVGDVVSAGVCLPVSLLAAGYVQLNLEARHVQALGICVACPRRCPVVRRGHGPPGSPAGPQSAGVRRAVIYLYSFLEVPRVRRPSRCEREGYRRQSDYGPLPRRNTLRAQAARSNIVRTERDALPHQEYSVRFQHKLVVVRILPVRIRGDCVQVMPHHHPSSPPEQGST
jgi:hypothetical protein